MLYTLVFIGLSLGLVSLAIVNIRICRERDEVITDNIRQNAKIELIRKRVSDENEKYNLQVEINSSLKDRNLTLKREKTAEREKFVHKNEKGEERLRRCHWRLKFYQK